MDNCLERRDKGLRTSVDRLLAFSNSMSRFLKICRGRN
jgi:hypothetical protein